MEDDMRKMLLFILMLIATGLIATGCATKGSLEDRSESKNPQERVIKHGTPRSDSTPGSGKPI